MRTTMNLDSRYMLSGMSNQEIDRITAYVKGKPIRTNKEMIDKLSCEPLSTEWKQSLLERSNWWYSGYSGLIDKNLQKILVLRDKLLTFGGEEACMPANEEDLAKIMNRGQFWYGANLTKMPGVPSQCHSNSAALWNMNRDKVVIATGYALTRDGMWRQHTWCVQIRPRKNRVVETTVPRIGYFGFVLNEQESELFFDDNWI